MQITLQHVEGARFLVEARQHRLAIDQPTEDGATDHGMTPAELLLAALAGSVGQHVAQYLRLRSLPSRGLQIRVEADRTTRPLRLINFRVEVVAPGLSERQLRALEKSLPSGLVETALSLENSLKFSVSSSQAEDVTP